MLTGKQRSYLKKLAHVQKPLAQVGKEGLSEGFISQLDQLLELHELVKVNVLENSLIQAKEVAFEVAEQLNAEFVQAIGNKFTLYRESRENPLILIPDADNTRAIKNLKKREQSRKEDRLNKRGGKISKPMVKKILKKKRQKDQE